jgi:hypothetical protein
MLNTYSAIKNMSLAGKWMELKIIMISEISQMQRHKYHIFLSYVESRSKEKKNMNTKGGLLGRGVTSGGGRDRRRGVGEI